MSTDWATVGAVGQWAGALATTAAVIVALKLGRDASAVKVKVNAEIGFQASRIGVGPTVVIYSAVNVGQRRVELVSAGAVLPNKLQMVWPDQSLAAVRTALEEGQETRYYVEVWRLAEALVGQGYGGRTKLRVYFGDSRGVRHFKTWHFDPSGWLEREG